MPISFRPMMTLMESLNETSESLYPLDPFYEHSASYLEDFYDEIEIYGADEALENYDSCWDDEDSFHRDESAHGVMDPVDAIFQR